MGAVQKLATMVIVGLVALATVLVVYLAADGGRRDSSATAQDHLAIERGTDLYITYCLQCHGPAGLGSLAGEEPPRVGGILNQAPIPAEQQLVTYQSDNPAEQALAEEFIRYRLQYGVPDDPRSDDPVAMPAFGEELNVEEINDLVYLIMNGDWDYVYNESLLTTGEGVAQAECDEGDAEACERVEDPEPVYPTVPATPVPEGDDAEAAAAGANEGESGGVAEGTPDPAASGGSGTVLEALDPADWSETALTVAPGDEIQMVNAGVLEHNFTVDELGIAQDLSQEPVTITIPQDAAPGEYEFYCSVPG
ncbi:MAG: c-type cytochrome, partial [Chloroflexota bacterium]|nr:c-type cytochrome [Chloroflexota bacterium]